MLIVEVNLVIDADLIATQATQLLIEAVEARRPFGLARFVDHPLDLGHIDAVDNAVVAILMADDRPIVVAFAEEAVDHLLNFFVWLRILLLP